MAPQTAGRAADGRSVRDPFVPRCRQPPAAAAQKSNPERVGCKVQLSDKCQLIRYIEKCHEIRDKPIILIARVLGNLAPAVALGSSDKASHRGPEEINAPGFAAIR